MALASAQIVSAPAVSWELRVTPASCARVSMRSMVSRMEVCREMRSIWWRRGFGEVEQLLGEVVDALHLGGDQHAEAAAELRVLEARWQQVGEGLDRDEGVADFVGEAGADQANGGELFGLAGLHGEARAGEDVVP